MSSSAGTVASSRTPVVGPGLRLVRGGLLAAATLSVAAWAHASADGNLPGAGGLVAIWALTTLVAAGLLVRPASVRRIVLLLCAGQGVLHLLLSVVVGHGERPAPASGPSAQYYAANSMLAESGSAGAVAAHGSAADLTAGLGGLLGHLTTGSGLWMVATHLVAAAVVGLWLAAGEKALWSALAGLAQTVAAGVSTLLVRLLASPTLVPVGAQAASFPEPFVGRGIDRLLRCPRRGPPAEVPVAR